MAVVLLTTPVQAQTWPSRLVKAPWVKCSPAHLECVFLQTVELPSTRVGESNYVTFGRVIGLSDLMASADATAVSGALNGGQFLPLVFPVNIVDCEQNGDLGIGAANWQLSQPGSPPVGQEYIVPLCKTGGGSFMILDLDGSPNNCDDEVTNPPPIEWDTFPVSVDSDNGNNCAKKMLDEVNALHGTIGGADEPEGDDDDAGDDES